VLRVIAAGDTLTITFLFIFPFGTLLHAARTGRMAMDSRNKDKRGMGTPNTWLGLSS
jgi:hypothetical protein